MELILTYKKFLLHFLITAISPSPKCWTFTLLWSHYLIRLVIVLEIINQSSPCSSLLSVGKTFSVSFSFFTDLESRKLVSRRLMPDVCTSAFRFIRFGCCSSFFCGNLLWRARWKGSHCSVNEAASCQPSFVIPVKGSTA